MEPSEDSNAPPQEDAVSSDLEVAPNQSFRSFDEDEHISASTEHLVTNPSSSQNSSRHQPNVRKSDCSSDWCTTPPIYFLLFTNLVMILMTFILPVICSARPNQKKPVAQCLIDPFSVLIYTHTLYWFSHLIVDQYLKYHHRRGRLRGYLEFYIQTKNLRRTPFYIISFGNAILLATVTGLHDYCDHNTNTSCEEKETDIEALRGLISLECMVVAFMWVKYIMAVRKFKKDNRPPDLYRTEFRDQVLGLRMPISPGNNVWPPESRDEVDILELQSELLLYLCPNIGVEADVLQQVITQARSYPRQ